MDESRLAELENEVIIRQRQEIEKLKSELAQIKAVQASSQRFREALDLIGDIAEDYDGWREAPALKKLIEELKAIARKATDTNDPMYCVE